MQTAGRLWRWNRQSWEQVTDENDDPVRDLWWTTQGDDEEMYVATWKYILHRVRGTWRREMTTLRRPVGVWGDDEGKVYAVGGGIVASRGDGVWSREALPSGASGITAICGSSREEVVAVGADGTAVRSSGDGRWVGEPTGVDQLLLALARGPDGYWAVGNDGVALRRDASGRWQKESVGQRVQLADVHCDGDRVFAVGGLSVFERRPNGVWSALPVPTTSQLAGIGGAPGQFVVVGLGGTVLHRLGEQPFVAVRSTFRGELSVVATPRQAVWYFGGEQFYTD
jgi:hypothetical protein